MHRQAGQAGVILMPIEIARAPFLSRTCKVGSLVTTSLDVYGCSGKKDWMETSHLPLLLPLSNRRTGLQTAGYFHDETFFWQQGQSEWLPLRSLPSLKHELDASQPESTAKGRTKIPAGGAEDIQTTEELSSFMAEISAIEAEYEVSDSKHAAMWRCSLCPGIRMINNE